MGMPRNKAKSINFVRVNFIRLMSVLIIVKKLVSELERPNRKCIIFLRVYQHGLEKDV